LTTTVVVTAEIILRYNPKGAESIKCFMRCENRLWADLQVNLGRDTVWDLFENYHHIGVCSALLLLLLIIINNDVETLCSENMVFNTTDDDSSRHP
jgi:hypothetical protein